MLASFTCEWSEVHLNFQGNWTGLFCAGDQFRRPPEIQQHEYVLPSSAGYDGQFYQLIAHDPFFERRYDRYVDAPRLRYRRILVPGLAWLLGAGQPSLIDFAYLAVYSLFVALGTFCLAQLAVDAGRSAWWGLLFLFTPATLIGIERMTVDTNLTALAAAVVLAARRARRVLLWCALAAAMLSKETGVLLIGGVVFWLIRQKQFRLAAVLSSSVLPALAWYIFVQTHTAGDYVSSGFKFLTAFFVVLTLPLDPGIPSLLFRVATVAAIVALLWAAGRSIVLAIQDRFRTLEILCSFLFGMLLLLLQLDALWVEPNAFLRLQSPFLVCLVTAEWRRSFVQLLVLFAAATLPICMQLAVHLAGPALRPLFSR